MKKPDLIMKAHEFLDVMGEWLDMKKKLEKILKNYSPSIRKKLMSDFLKSQILSREEQQILFQYGKERRGH